MPEHASSVSAASEHRHRPCPRPHDPPRWTTRARVSWVPGTAVRPRPLTRLGWPRSRSATVGSTASNRRPHHYPRLLTERHDDVIGEPTRNMNRLLALLRNLHPAEPTPACPLQSLQPCLARAHPVTESDAQPKQIVHSVLRDLRRRETVIKALEEQVREAKRLLPAAPPSPTPTVQCSGQNCGVHRVSRGLNGRGDEMPVVHARRPRGGRWPGLRSPPPLRAMPAWRRRRRRSSSARRRSAGR
jgi:hypothetical protein